MPRDTVALTGHQEAFAKAFPGRLYAAAEKGHHTDWLEFFVRRNIS